jgi:hypothetical protein
VLRDVLIRVSATLRCPELPDEFHQRAYELAVASRSFARSVRDRSTRVESLFASLGLPSLLGGNCPVCGTSLQCGLQGWQKELPDPLSWPNKFMPLELAQQDSKHDRLDQPPSQVSRAKSGGRGRNCTKQSKASRRPLGSPVSSRKRYRL